MKGDNANGLPASCQWIDEKGLGRLRGVEDQMAAATASVSDGTRDTTRLTDRGTRT